MQENHARRSAFVLRIWQDDDGRTWGQVMEPMTGWQRPFDGVDDLCQLILAQMGDQSEQAAELANNLGET